MNEIQQTRLTPLYLDNISKNYKILIHIYLVTLAVKWFTRHIHHLKF